MSGSCSGGGGWSSWGSISSSPAVPSHRCSQAGLRCLAHSALLITPVNCMKSLPCRGAEGRWSRRERVCPPAQPGGGAARPELPRHSPRSSPRVGRRRQSHHHHPAARRSHAGPAALGGLAAGHRLPAVCRGQLPAPLLPRQEQRLLGPRRPPGSLLLRLVLPEERGLLPGLPGHLPPSR